jgi:glycosyltransferase involved in cell wall biosynthesis
MNPAPTGKRAALACCGLGHVRRGNETWAHGVAEALHSAGEPITLFTGGHLEAAAPVEPLWNIPRDTRWLTRLSWHRRYMLEQRTFYWALRRRLSRRDHDIIHIADPQVAWWSKHASANGGPDVIYKDGLLLGTPWLRQFRWAQVLAPFYREEGVRAGCDVDRWFVIPHLVDTERFEPAEDRTVAQRRFLGEALDPGAFAVLAVGALGAANNKRLDYAAEEIAAAGDPSIHLIIAGQAGADESEIFEARFRPRLGNRLHLLTNVAPSDMPELYQCADMFAHGALREPFGIVFIEAMASGLPVAAHQFEVTRWIVGDGGAIDDFNRPGALTAIVRRWRASPDERLRTGENGRARAINTFSPAKIVPLYRDLYARIREARRRGE